MDSYDYIQNGLKKEEAGEHEEALKDFNAAIKLEPDAFVYSLRADVYEKLGNLQNALEDYTKAIKLDPADASYRRYRGELEVELELYEEALEDFTRSIILKPMGTTYHSRASVYEKLGNPQEALKDYTKAINLMPDYAPFRTLKGYLELQLELYDDALEDFTKSLELEPDAEVYSLRGKVYDKLQDYKSALKDFTRAVKLKNNNVKYFLQKARIECILKNFDEALNDTLYAIQLDVTLTISYRMLGDIYIALNKSAEAIEAYSKGVDIGKERGDIYGQALCLFGRAVNLKQIGLLEQAEEDLSSAKKLYPEGADGFEQQYKETAASESSDEDAPVKEKKASSSTPRHPESDNDFF